MARIALNKGTLHREMRRLRTVERVLPSLDMKRRQLIAERRRAEHELAGTHERIQAELQRVSAELPMIAYRRVELSGLIRIEGVRTDEENLLGVTLPIFRDVDVEIAEYGLLARPHWVDAALAALERVLRLRLRARIEQDRLERLEAALRKVTQRVNLFEKVLIPRTQENIRRIRLALADGERAAVVRAKIAKRKHEAAT